MADITLDTLLVKINADTKPLSDALSGLSKTANSSLAGIGDAASRASGDMARALGGFIKDGKLGFEDLKSSALSALAEIANNALRSGLGNLLGPSASGFLGSVGSNALAGLFGHLLSGRASGGPVAAGAPYVVGEYGREVFVPRVPGTVVPPAGSVGTGRRAISITVNVQGSGGTSEMRRSAGQVASAVARSLARAERNL